MVSTWVMLMILLLAGHRVFQAAVFAAQLLTSLGQAYCYTLYYCIATFDCLRDKQNIISILKLMIFTIMIASIFWSSPLRNHHTLLVSRLWLRGIGFSSGSSTCMQPMGRFGHSDHYLNSRTSHWNTMIPQLKLL